jgi:hypothetical protein
MSGIIAQNSGRHTGLVKAASAGGVWNLIQTLTSDGSDADLSFTSGIDSTYDEYVFKYINIHPETDNQHFKVAFRDGSTAYDATLTTTYFEAVIYENNTGAVLRYEASLDSAQVSGAQIIGPYVANNADASISGELYIYDPSSTVFVKHFISRSNNLWTGDGAASAYVGGYCNTTDAIDGVQFTFNSGEIQGGSISLYGIT